MIGMMWNNIQQGNKSKISNVMEPQCSPIKYLFRKLMFMTISSNNNNNIIALDSVSKNCSIKTNQI